MLRPRVIPFLLVRGGGLFKTTRFGDPKYVGDPLNAVRIFNEKEADELAVLDIDASREGTEPDYTLIRNLAAESRMPVCYGGGVRTLDQFQRVVEFGVEKVAISSHFYVRPQLVTEAARVVGSQSVVVVLDVKRNGRGEYEVRSVSGTKTHQGDPMEWARRAEELGAGEIVVNNIDRDGTGQGYDMELVARIHSAVGIPMTVVGGAGSLSDIGELFAGFGVIGAGAGSLFVFKGKLRAVLISYPTRFDIDRLWRDCKARPDYRSPSIAHAP